MMTLFLKYLWWSAERFGLLDCEDVDQISSRFSSNLADRRFYSEALIFLSIASVLLYFGAFLAIAIMFCVSLIVSFLPPLIWHLYTRSDRSFHSFIGSLRQRELALFGIKNLNTSSSTNLRVCYKRARLECIKQLREHINAFNTSSITILQLTSDGFDTDSLLFNFVNEDLHKLASKQIPALDDDDIQIPSLKALWRYAFLTRSELIRICILTFLDDFPSVLFFSRLNILVKAIIKTLTIYLASDNSTLLNRSIQQNHGFPSLSKHIVQLSPLKICIAQLEWTLENLYAMDDEFSPGNVAATIACLKNVISVMEEGSSGTRGSGNGSQTDHDRMSDTPTGNGSSIASDFETLVEPLRSLDNDEFQIFEMDTSEQTQQHRHQEGVECLDDESLGRSFEGCSNNSHFAMLRELGYAIESRKEQCIVREMEALARARKVPVEEIRREELDRAPFEQRIDRGEERSQEQRDKIATCRPFGKMPSNADLDEIIARRKQFQESSVFGESSKSEDEN